jgi:tRNA modification GTPase
MTETDTIAAIATPPGRGGVCIIRLSGSQCKRIAQAIIGQLPKPRYATFSKFTDEQGQLIDEGLALYFPAPHSYTGEDVLELHGHGGVIVSDMILQAALRAGSRMARPGEFSERAFLNDKLDLTQVEAVVDLIDAGSRQAARAAVRTLDGEFSRHIHDLLAELIGLRVYIESALDFADEEIEFIQSGDIENRLSQLLDKIQQLARVANRGRVLGEGLQIVIAGKPNAGKSSLMNVLCESNRAIVTEIPGTTRDVIRENVLIEGIPVHLHDTAGLRDWAEPIEQEGIRRAKDHVSVADLVLWIHDDSTEIDSADYLGLEGGQVILIKNKIDLSGKSAGLKREDNHDCLYISTTTGAGMDDLRSCIAHYAMGKEQGENEFSARRRHLDAIEQTQMYLENAQARLAEQLSSMGTGELLAEELRLAQHALGEITGEFTSDDLLGKIFTEFCIGK